MPCGPNLIESVSSHLRTYRGMRPDELRLAINANNPSKLTSLRSIRYAIAELIRTGRARRADDRKVYANPGDKITCENGHEVATISHTICIGDMFSRNAFRDWKQREPAIGTMSQPCEICGKPWFNNNFPMKIHFKDGWR